jgi:hypothetical protein
MLFSNRITRAGSWRGLALLGLLSLAGSAATAQSLNYSPATVQNVTGTYTDLGTTGTVIATTSNDDANSSPQNIGFAFNYNGQSFTQFILNTNGLIKLGSTAPSRADLFAAPVQDARDPSSPVLSTNAADQNLILPFNFDLEPGTGTGGAEFRMNTTGTAPNRVCTIQWKNVSDKAGFSGTTAVAKQYANLSFQVKLYETTNQVEFVYDAATEATAGTEVFKSASVGLKGSGSANGQVVLLTKGSVTPWSDVAFLNAPYTGNSFNFRRTVRPDAGRTYRFAPQVANDAGVAFIYSMAKIPSRESQVVRARIVNTGSGPLSLVPVTLTVSGANTYTNTQIVNSLASRDSITVTFPAFTSNNTGTNNMVVSVTPDGNNSNNSFNYTQQVGSEYSIATGSNNGSAVGFGTATPVAAFAVKYNTSVPRRVNSITTFIFNSATEVSVGKTVYVAVLSSTGTVLGRTPDYVVQAADANTRKTFTFSTPVTVPAGEFLAAFVQTNAAGGTAYFPVGTQNEVPTRPNTFFSIAPFSPTTGGTPVDASPRNFGIYMIEAAVSTVTGVSKALETAVSVYPNPSNGEFSLEVRGANAKEALQVEVTNVLGQRVYTTTARDNFENKLNLSHLAAGMYTLKLSNGSEYMMRNIVVRK